MAQEDKNSLDNKNPLDYTLKDQVELYKREMKGFVSLFAMIPAVKEELKLLSKGSPDDELNDLAHKEENNQTLLKIEKILFSLIPGAILYAIVMTFLLVLLITSIVKR